MSPHHHLNDISQTRPRNKGQSRTRTDAVTVTRHLVASVHYTARPDANIKVQPLASKEINNRSPSE